MHTRASRVSRATLVGALLAAACDGSPGVDPSRRVRGRMRLELAAGSAAQQPTRVTDVLHARLLVAPVGGGDEQDLLDGFEGGAEVTFDVTVPAGPTRLRARVLSNRDTVLLEGETTANLDRDGFQVVVPVVAVRPVLVASPPTIQLARSTLSDFPFAATLVVSNPGVGTLLVRADPAASTVLRACDGPCVSFIPSLTGSLPVSVPAGRSVTITVGTQRTGLSTAQPYTLRLTAPEGYVDLLVRGPIGL